MNSNEIRSKFLDFFKSKSHVIVDSAPMVIKNDPTLMFTNAGMNQFKDIFLGNSPIKHSRIADTQKCLRVSGKHNDLEEVGFDTYHHTMFEMLGNWSFGDYFKNEAIEWAWEFLVDIMKIDTERIYVTYFEGSNDDNLDPDNEAKELWLKKLPAERVLTGSKKDNFWEMGDTGPCGPCSEIHVDLRDDAERKKIDGALLVNKDNPLVIEIWNLVFIQYNRLVDGSLHQLPNKHVDTGMGFERLCMVIQGKKSNYDTDVFTGLISKLCEISSIKYGSNEKSDVAIRVAADHIRAVAFSIADGQLPSNTGAGYVIRRILRRSIRYGYTYLNINEPFIYKLVNVLSSEMGDAFPEIRKQEELIEKVIKEEESSFLRTLGNGINRFENYINKNRDIKIIPGDFAFELYDTYGFPIDLTSLMAKEINIEIDMNGFSACLEDQKNRSRNDAKTSAGDWIDINPYTEPIFLGYDSTELVTKILKYRKVEHKGKNYFQVVLEHTPFYAESGGQIGDSGIIQINSENYNVLNTIKENNLIIHILQNLPEKLNAEVKAFVDIEKRNSISKNHSATHLLHFALRKALGNHVEQKGSLVHYEYLRFDFSHFNKLSDEEINSIEVIVNDLIFSSISLEENREISINKAIEDGAIALFGEKYGDSVRTIRFDKAIELCGGTHVNNTSAIGLFKIISESSIASGIRRIEAVTEKYAFNYLIGKEKLLNNINIILNRPKDIVKAIETLMVENKEAKKEIEVYENQYAAVIKKELKDNLQNINNINFSVVELKLNKPALIKDIAFQLRKEINSLFLALLYVNNDKLNVAVVLSDDMVARGLNAAAIIKILAPFINGGGGGQAFFATAAGSNLAGIKQVTEECNKILASI